MRLSAASLSFFAFRFPIVLLGLACALPLNAHALSTPEIPDLRRDTELELRRSARQHIGRFKYRKKAEARGAYLDGDSSAIASDLDLLPETVAQMSALMPLVEEMGMRFEIGPHLVMAVIHTESAFDSRARSGANAYGLMQIVPVFAGRSALSYLTGEDRRPEAEQLFDAKLNVELGTAYLAILRERHFGHIKDVRVRNLAVLAAYNWGPTRVNRMLRQAGGTLTTDGFRELLAARAPRETIDYVARVTRRAKHYHAWFKHARASQFSPSIGSETRRLPAGDGYPATDWKFPVAIR